MATRYRAVTTKCHGVELAVEAPGDDFETVGPAVAAARRSGKTRPRHRTLTPL